MQLKKLTKGSNVYNHHFEIRFPFGKKKACNFKLWSYNTKAHSINFCITRTFFKKKKGVSTETSLQSAKSKQTDKTQEARILTDPTKFLKLLTKEEPKRKEWHC